ncbi:MAG: alpha/beta hydrolase [Candidatus Omnitrophica bacterium]|nr:alpha/beta hydrolase [Candidatus Omnitrophota bacterium]
MKITHPLLLILFTIALTSATHAEILPQEFVYKEIGEVSLTLKVYEPDSKKFPGPNPAIVYFFGGGWRQGSMSQFEPFAQHYAELGLVGVTADYRVQSRHGVTPIECISDARSAVRWVRSHAEELGIDPDRIASSGGSAGGHLAACTALVSEFDAESDDLTVSATPDALILFNPRMNMEGIRHRLDLGENQLLASPYHQLEGDLPPTLILHGTADKTVPISDPEEFTQKAKSRGLPCELAAFEGKGHGWFNARNAENYQEVLVRVDDFLRSIGWIR